MIQKYTIPDEYQNNIQSCLEKRQQSLTKPSALATAVQLLSNHYQITDSTTPWDQPWAETAYLCYYFPVNYIRNRAVFDKIPTEFWRDIASVIDYGSGGGTSILALMDHIHLESNYYAIEVSQKANNLYQQLKRQNHPDVIHKTTLNEIPRKSLGIFSYSMNELDQRPPWLLNFEKLIIVEPSTRHFGRQLLETRQHLIDNGYSIWAPCTHQFNCPLTTHSKKDWCHDRGHWQQPHWFQKLESLLPIKNNTLTYSYLVASRQPYETQSYGRIVGDPLVEKGKVRWLFCRGEEREFLSWLKRQGEAPSYQRGDLLKVDGFDKKGNELRLRDSERRN